MLVTASVTVLLTVVLAVELAALAPVPELVPVPSPATGENSGRTIRGAVFEGGAESFGVHSGSLRNLFGIRSESVREGFGPVFHRFFPLDTKFILELTMHR